MAAGEIAYAKLNLALHVRRREADGYHAIETLFAFCEDGDALAIGDTPGLTVTGPFADAIAERAENLVTRAARGFAAAMGNALVAGFALEKRLPVAAGIGGGSADAAATLRLLCHGHGLPPEDARVTALAETLGADVPGCLLSRTSWGMRRGDRLEPAPDALAGVPVLLVNPRVPLSTGEVFAGWDGVDRGPLGRGDPLAAALAGRNDLEPPAIARLPVIGGVLALLRAQAGATLVRMSGSGATCFALFDRASARDAADARVAAARPDWWRLATRLR